MKRAFAIILFFLLTPAYAALYKWTDEQGNTHYGERPPNHQKAQSIAPPPPRASSFELDSKRTQSLREGILTQAAENRENKEKSQEAAQKEQEKEEFCTQLRQRLTTFQTTPRIRVEGEDGKHRYVDDKQKQEKEMQQRLAKDCS